MYLTHGASLGPNTDPGTQQGLHQTQLLGPPGLGEVESSSGRQRRQMLGYSVSEPRLSPGLESSVSFQSETV